MSLTFSVVPFFVLPNSPKPLELYIDGLTLLDSAVDGNLPLGPIFLYTEFSSIKEINLVIMTTYIS